MSRADFHQLNAERATAEALRLLGQRAELGPRWLTWVASELYRLSPPPYAAMVRRELQRLTLAQQS
ncbi:hypothetical protein [Stutzerimonas stutzeri]|uniref:Uncharacterized protein n=1 Tax=Stutzerimonas stutzeri KOS6 TaxID=1218352 RepID=A0A061JT75_STUST|nr:hypothetical protein [Stutzerimonas stutzeri]EWC41359.1 hypothetical protein B597_010530 [Stutzerimonas stutzeri KOS6]